MNEEKLQQEIRDYSAKNGYVADHFATATCWHCKGTEFWVLMNETEGVAARICTKCDAEHGIGDSDEYVDEVESVQELACTCGANRFGVVGGVSLYAGTQDVRWFYLGCECAECGLSGVYGDWKNEASSYRALLARV